MHLARMRSQHLALSRADIATRHAQTRTDTNMCAGEDIDPHERASVVNTTRKQTAQNTTTVSITPLSCG